MLFVYLDSNALQQPMDRRTDASGHERSQAVFWILSRAERGQLGIVWSPPLEVENIERAPADRAVWCQYVRNLATLRMEVPPEILARTRQFQLELGLRTMDAAHLACAESANALLITEDRKFLSRASKSSIVRVGVFDLLTAKELLGRQLDEKK